MKTILILMISLALISNSYSQEAKVAGHKVVKVDNENSVLEYLLDEKGKTIGARIFTIEQLATMLKELDAKYKKDREEVLKSIALCNSGKTK